MTIGLILSSLWSATPALASVQGRGPLKWLLPLLDTACRGVINSLQFFILRMRGQRIPWPWSLKKKILLCLRKDLC